MWLGGVVGRCCRCRGGRFILVLYVCERDMHAEGMKYGYRKFGASVWKNNFPCFFLGKLRLKD